MEAFTCQLCKLPKYCFKYSEIKEHIFLETTVEIFLSPSAHAQMNGPECSLCAMNGVYRDLSLPHPPHPPSSHLLSSLHTAGLNESIKLWIGLCSSKSPQLHAEKTFPVSEMVHYYLLPIYIPYKNTLWVFCNLLQCTVGIYESTAYSLLCLENGHKMGK